MPFEFVETPISGMMVITPRVFPDGRGFFLESYKRSEFIAAGISAEFVQDNHSVSAEGVLRGLHFQNPPHAQGKLVRVVRGAVWDVGVDLRTDSSTYGRWFGAELNAENQTMLYIPPGFAHGFLTLADDTHFHYKCTAEYAPSADAGIRWDDPDIGVEWPLDRAIGGADRLSISAKDEILPFLKDTAL